MVMIMLLQFCLVMELLCILEMMDGDNPASYLCSPEGLLQQIWSVSKKWVHLIGRNTNEGFGRAEAVRSFTYFKMNDKIFRAENWSDFIPFAFLTWKCKFFKRIWLAVETKCFTIKIWEE
ncbi:hypothetical protein DVH24_003971 [Malus domestica]|uniref:Uncharacterized protein n=1 Tax=Malus domestica TaxID=3750 RepID=A0A498K4Z4_MALDO|nr:hypothetical protein DVH24_003971 [Malus domestica]